MCNRTTDLALPYGLNHPPAPANLPGPALGKGIFRSKKCNGHQFANRIITDRPAIFLHVSIRRISKRAPDQAHNGSGGECGECFRHGGGPVLL